MARIRTTKPEIWDSDDFLSLSAVGRDVFHYLYSNADDEGRLKQSPAHIAARLRYRLRDVLPQLEEMERRQMIARYDHPKVVGQLFQVVNWHHQRVEKPTPSSLPAPPRSILALMKQRASSGPKRIRNRSGNDPGPVGERSVPRARGRTVSVPVPDLLGAEGAKGASSTPPSPSPPPADWVELLQGCEKLMGRTLSGAEVQAAERLMVDAPRLTAAAALERMAEYGRWRAEHDKAPARTLQLYLDAAIAEDRHLADQGVTRPRGQNGAVSIGSVLHG